MEMLGLLLWVVGGIIGLVGGIWFLVVAFKESIWWGLGCLFVPFVGLIFLILHWSEAGKPFLVSLGGQCACHHRSRDGGRGCCADGTLIHGR